MRILSLFFIAAALLTSCVSATYSPMYIDYPKISIADITSSYYKATVTVSPLNASYVWYALTKEEDPEPSASDYVRVEAGGDRFDLVVDGLDSETGYRIYVYSESSVYKDAYSPVAMAPFKTNRLLSLNPDGRTANCYIVPEAGCYKFNATVKGCGAESVGRVATAEVIWSDVANFLGNIELLDDGWIVFVAKKNTGNGVLAVKDEAGNILWSWHIWCPGGTPSDDVFTNSQGTRYHVMDRNLGARSAITGSTCTLYQWGRKDPFINTHFVYVGNKTTTDRHIVWWPPVKWDETEDEDHNNIAWTIANPAVWIDNAGHETGAWAPVPDYSLWGDPTGYNAAYASTGGWSAEKSDFDPCPVGYRVPNVYTFSAFSLSDSVIGGWDGGYWLKKDEADETGSWFPATCSRDPSTGTVVRGSLMEMWMSNPSGSTVSAKPRMLGAHATSMNPSSLAVAAYGHAVRCVRHSESDTKTNYQSL